MSYSTALVHTVAVKLRRVLVLLPEAGKPIVDGLRSAILTPRARSGVLCGSKIQPGPHKMWVKSSQDERRGEPLAATPPAGR